MSAPETAPMDVGHIVALLREVVAKGGHLAVTATGDSMRPAIAPGAQLILGPVAADEPRLGQLVARADGGRLTVHRVTAIDGDQVVTRGDACNCPDPPIPRSEIVAVVRTITPSATRRVRQTISQARSFLARGRGRIGDRMPATWGHLRRAARGLLIATGLLASAAAWPCDANINWAVPGTLADWTSTLDYCKWQAAQAASGSIPAGEDVIGLAYTHSEAPNYTDAFFLMQLAGVPVTGFTYQVDHPGVAGSGADSVLTTTCTSATHCTTVVNVTGGTCGANIDNVAYTTTVSGDFILFGGNNFPAAYYTCFDNTAYTALICPTSKAPCTAANSVSTVGFNDASPNNFIGSTAVLVRGFVAEQRSDGVELTWATGSELHNIGFQLHRDDPRGPPINPRLIPGLNTAPVGRTYRFLDPQGDGHHTYYLEAVSFDGSQTWGPITVADSGRARPLPEHLAPTRTPAPAPAAATVAMNGVPQAFARVRTEGIYQLDSQSLSAVGFSASSYGVRFNGAALPTFAASGGAQLFYAPPVSAADRAEDAYEIASGAAKTGAAASSVGLTCPSPAPSTTPPTFSATVSIAEHQIFDPGAQPDLRFPWTYAASGASASVVAFAAPGYGGGPATLTVHLLGMTNIGPAPNHHAQLALNGTPLPDVEFAGLGADASTMSIPAGLLQPGSNLLSLTALADLPGVTYDLIGLSSIDLTYARTFRADGDALRFTATGGSVVSLGGFSAAPAIVDLTDPTSPIFITPETCAAMGGSTTVSVAFTAPGSGLHTFYAAVPKNPALQASQASRVPAGSADWVAVVGDGLEKALEPLTALRRSQGLRTLTVPVASLYDRFGGGQHGFAAIKAYLAQLSPPPKDVVLVGRASLDPHDYLLTGTPDLVPTDIVITADLQTVAAFDGTFVAGSDGRTPFAAVGRIPATTASDLSAYVSKVVTFEAGAGPSGQAVFAADYQDPTGILDAFFQTESDALAAQMTNEQIAKVYLPQSTTTDLMTALAAGPDLVTYHGHADGLDWSSTGLLSDSDLPNLPAARPFLLVTVDCWDGMFAMPTFMALAPQMVQLSEGGAVAAWAASSLVNESDDPAIDAAIFPLLQSSQMATVGDLSRAAMTTLAALGGTQSDLVRVYNLIGDPATRNPLY